jgi:hypothetical protein
MVNFLFTKGQRVRLKATGEVGRVEYCSTDPTTNAPFYQVRFDEGKDGKTERIAENELAPA